MAAAFAARELDIMAVLWDNGPCTVAEVRVRLADPLSHSTTCTSQGCSAYVYVDVTGVNCVPMI